MDPPSRSDRSPRSQSEGLSIGDEIDSSDKLCFGYISPKIGVLSVLVVECVICIILCSLSIFGIVVTNGEYAAPIVFLVCKLILGGIIGVSGVFALIHNHFHLTMVFAAFNGINMLADLFTAFFSIFEAETEEKFDGPLSEIMCDGIESKTCSGAGSNFLLTSGLILLLTMTISLILFTMTFDGLNILIERKRTKRKLKTTARKHYPVQKYEGEADEKFDLISKSPKDQLNHSPKEQINHSPREQESQHSSIDQRSNSPPLYPGAQLIDDNIYPPDSTQPYLPRHDGSFNPTDGTDDDNSPPQGSGHVGFR